MADKSFNNIIQTRSVSLAIEQILIAPSTQTWSPTRVVLSHTSLPTGFRHLGAVVEDQVSLTLSKELFQLQTGVPKVLQYSAVIGVSGRLEVLFHSFSQRVMAYAMGNVDPVNTVSTIITLASTGHANTTAYLLAALPGVTIGDVLVASANTPSIASTDNEAEVSSIGTGANSLVLYFTSPGFLDTPTSAGFIGKLTSVAVPAGTSKQKEYHIIGVADTIDGYQVVHDMQKARVGAGDMQEGFRPAENHRIQGRWELFGYNATRYPPDTELVVAERFWFPKS
jgi:hypothetical protein